MRRLAAPLATVLLVPLIAALPVLGGGGADRDPVPARVQALPLVGVDAEALADTPAPGTPVVAAGGDPALVPSGGGRVPAGVGVVGEPTDAPQLEPAVVTPRTDTEEFGLVGVTSPAPLDEESRVVVRVREDGAWGPWTQLPVSEHGPDPGSAEAAGARFGTEPLLTDSSDGVQVRIDTPDGEVPEGTAVNLIDSPVVAQDQELTATLPVSSAAALGVQPTIISRAQWGADESQRNGFAGYSDTIKVGFVHHTASSSNYSPGEAAKQMRNLYSWYVNGLRYSDMAYNFLIDRYGRLYEGRAGGIDRPVIGGHTAGFNNDTFAVSAIGNFEDFNPPADQASAMYTSIAQLLAWKLGMYSRDPLGSTTLVSDSGAGTSRYAPGEKARTTVIAGHGDIGSTSCPGRFLRQYLPTIRDLTMQDLGAAFLEPRAKPAKVAWGGAPATVVSRTTQPITWRAEFSSVCQPDRVLRVLEGTQAEGQPVTVAWDQKDQTGAQVPPGTYRVRLSGSGASGPTATWAGTVTITPTAESPPDPCGVPESFTISGAGWGHGVGLSQYGALGQAREDRTAAQIVQHYFPTSTLSSVTDDVELRVGLVHQAATAAVRTESLGGGGGGIEVQVGDTVWRGGPGDTVSFSVSGSTVKADVTAGATQSLGAAPTVAVRWAGTRVPGGAGTGPTLLNVTGPGESFASAGHRYRHGWVEIGTVPVSGSYRLSVVNLVRVHDEYLYGVGEVPSSWPAAAQQAQAIAARSYALAKYGTGKPRAACDCHVDDGGGPYYDQTFLAHAGETRPGAENWIAAVDATATGATTGQTLTYDGAPIAAFYTSSTGGRTTSSADVWGGALPWSVSVDDHWSDIADNPNRAWSVRVTQAQAKALFGLPEVATISVAATTESGTARTVRAVTRTGTVKDISGTTLRSSLGLKSAYVTAITPGGSTTSVPPPAARPRATALSLTAKPATKVRAGRTLRLVARATPAAAGIPVVRQVKVGSTWKRASAPARTNAKGKVVFTVARIGPARTKYVYRLKSKKVLSPVVVVRVTRR